MSFLPKIKRCPSCNSINIISTNGVSYENKFKSLQDWKLKKIFNCVKCKVELGLFSNNLNMQKNLIWLDLVRCQDNHFDDLLKLTKDKRKYLKNKSNKKYKNILKEIRDIQNKIRLDQAKLKVKSKMLNKPALIRHVY